MRTIKSFISVVVTFFRLALRKLFAPRKIRFGPIERISPNVLLEFNRGAKVTLGNRIRIHSGSKIKVRRGAKLSIGEGTKINYNCMIVCRQSVSIGEKCEFGPGVLVYDHDHDFRVGLEKRLYKSSDVVIGNRVWIGANTVILRGTVIGDDCVIGAGSVVRGTISPHTVLVQKREDTVVEF
ncbi:MAG: acyltransferase [Clostridia bacterium]|nr:acyltransferase [Clostridia bacterium]